MESNKRAKKEEKEKKAKAGIPKEALRVDVTHQG